MILSGAGPVWALPAKCIDTTEIIANTIIACTGNKAVFSECQHYESGDVVRWYGKCQWGHGGQIELIFSSSDNDPYKNPNPKFRPKDKDITHGAIFKSEAKPSIFPKGRILRSASLKAKVSDDFVPGYLGITAYDVWNSGSIPAGYLESLMKKIYQQLYIKGICIPFPGHSVDVGLLENEIGEQVESKQKEDAEEGEQSIEAVKEDVIEDLLPEDLCDNHVKDPDEEGVDCGGPCDACSNRLILDKTDYAVNFDGQDKIHVSGKVAKVMHRWDWDKAKYFRPVAGAEVTLTTSSSAAGALIGSQRTQTNSNGRFAFDLTLGKYDRRDELKNRKVVLNVSTEFLNDLIYLTQSQTAPEIINLKKNTSTPVGSGAWTTFSFDVIDAEDDVERIYISAPQGKLQWANNSRHLGTLWEGDENNQSQVELSGLYPGGTINIGWMPAKMGLTFDTSFWQKQKEAFFESDSTTVGTAKMTNEEIYNYAKGSIDASAEELQDALTQATKMIKSKDGVFIDQNTLKNYQQLVNSEASTSSIKVSNALGLFDRAFNGYKVYASFKGNTENMIKNMKAVVCEAETAGEGVVRGMIIAIDGVSLVESGFQAVFGKDFLTSTAGETLTQAKKFTVGAIIKGMKGTLEYAASTFEESRAVEQTRQIPIQVYAVDRAGNTSEVVTLPIDVLFYTTSQEN